LYTSSYFLIPTHTNNLQHKSAAFHDDVNRNLTFEENKNDSWNGGEFDRRGLLNNTGGIGGNYYLNKIGH
jgi:hypothetical protein